MNYKLLNSADTWNLFEVPTGLVIKEELKKDEARSLLRHLNMGGGFDGFTPAFFCNKIPS